MSVLLHTPRCSPCTGNTVLRSSIPVVSVLWRLLVWCAVSLLVFFFFFLATFLKVLVSAFTVYVWSMFVSTVGGVALSAVAS